MNSGALAGNLKLKIISADPVSLLTALNKCNVTILNAAVTDDLKITLVVPGNDYRAVARICEKRGESLKILHHKGVFWRLHGLVRRPILTCGILLLLYFLLWLPSRVFFVEVSGNVTVPTRMILAAAEELGVGFGTSRRAVNNERFKNGLLQKVPGIQWACVNTRGCVAIITVREAPPQTVEDHRGNLVRIVASTDGIVLSADSTRGTLLCHPGQAVIRGQTLISGYMDCGLSLRATGAEGEVYARTRHDLTVITPLALFKRGQENEKCIRLGLLIGKKRINLWKDSGNFHTTCGRMYTEYCIKLPGGYRLPVAITVDRITCCDTADGCVLPNGDMSAFAGDYLLSRLISGSILEVQVAQMQDAGVQRMECTFLCTEMIGREKVEEIGELHG